MINRMQMTFRVRDKGGSSGGKILSSEVPSFNWSEFLKAPNAEEFIRKAYFAATKKIIREIEEGKNSTVQADLQSVESVIARSLAFTRDEIRDWLKSRDWSRASDVKDIEKLRPQLEKHLPELVSRRNHFDAATSAKLADKVIAAVADEQDPIAEFLFTTLTTVSPEPKDDLFLL